MPRPSFLLPLLLLAAVLGLSACQDDASRLAEHIARGDTYMEEERYREAIIEFKSALQIDPNDAAAHYQLARAYLRTGKAREGYWELRETVRLDPSNHEAKLEFSQIAIIAGEKDEALALSSSVVEADPSNPMAHLVKAQALDSLDRRDEALASYARAVEVDPEAENAIRAYGMALLQRQRFEEAEAIYLQLAEAHPSFRNYTMMAGALGRQGRTRLDDREAWLKKAIEVAEEDERPIGIAQLASFYVPRGRMDDAFAVLESAIETEENNLQLIYLLARLHRAEGNFDKADAVIESTAQSHADKAGVHLVLSAYRARNGDNEGALAAVDEAIRIQPDNKQARLQKAELLTELGIAEERPELVDEARAIVDAILAAEPSDPVALYADARIKLGEGDFAGAEERLRAALDSRPDWARAHHLLGLTLAFRDDLPAARTALARALEIDAGLIDARFVLTQVHFRLSEWQYSVDRGLEVLRERPDDMKTRLLVAQSLVRLEQMEEAEQILAALPAEGRTAEAHYALGRIALAKGQWGPARQHFEAAVVDLPAEPMLLRSLLAVDRHDDRVAESKARIQAALAENPENGQLHQLLGAVAILEQRPEDAEAAFRKAIEVDPYDLSGYERLARMLARSGRLDETARIYEQAIEVQPEAAQLHHFLGILYELSGDRERAIERYEAAVRYGPDLAEAKNNLAYIYAESGTNLDRALDLAQDAKQQLPDSPSVSDTLGWVLYKRGVPSAAISYLKEAEKGTKPDDQNLGVVRFHLAQAYQANGDTQQALAALERSLEALDQQRPSSAAAASPAPKEPDWAIEARAKREEWRTAQTAGG